MTVKIASKTRIYRDMKKFLNEAPPISIESIYIHNLSILYIAKIRKIIHKFLSNCYFLRSLTQNFPEKHYFCE